MKKLAFIFIGIALTALALPPSGPSHLNPAFLGAVKRAAVAVGCATPAPVNLYIPGHNLTPTTNMPIAWSAVSGADYYNLFRSETPGSGYSLIAGNYVGTAYTNTNAASCITYYYVVTAYKDGCESTNSMETNAVNITNSSTLLVTADAWGK